MTKKNTMKTRHKEKYNIFSIEFSVKTSFTKHWILALKKKKSTSLFMKTLLQSSALKERVRVQNDSITLFLQGRVKFSKTRRPTSRQHGRRRGCQNSTRTKSYWPTWSFLVHEGHTLDLRIRLFFFSLFFKVFYYPAKGSGAKRKSARTRRKRIVHTGKRAPYPKIDWTPWDIDAWVGDKIANQLSNLLSPCIYSSFSFFFFC